jgi:hypothetical protein
MLRRLRDGNTNLASSLENQQQNKPLSTHSVPARIDTPPVAYVPIPYVVAGFKIFLQQLEIF